MSEKKTLLYVDDEPINLMLFQQLMSDHFEVLTANSGTKAIDVLANNPQINVVITDMKMPRMNGLEFILTAKKEYNHRPYLILSGFDIDAKVEKAMKDGFVASYMQKPFEVPQVLNEVERALAS